MYNAFVLLVFSLSSPVGRLLGTVSSYRLCGSSSFVRRRDLVPKVLPAHFTQSVKLPKTTFTPFLVANLQGELKGPSLCPWKETRLISCRECLCFA